MKHTNKPQMQKGKPHITTYNSPIPSEVLYRFGADGNLRLYSYDRLFFALYGYDGGTTRTYKYSFDLKPQWVNGRLEAVNFNMYNAMFYPNSYINFNNDGYYTKHYYNGMERIASRLGDQNISINVNDPELQDRKDWQDSLIRKNVTEITGYEFLPVGEEQNPDDPKPVFELPQVVMTALQPIGSGDIYYYHGNHLGSTAFVTDQTQTIVQGFLYAPFGEITNEHNSSFGSSVIPKYSFNAKELDEETGMYYYEARYYAPPVFISRDVLFEEKPWFTPYHYCSNNPVVKVDPSGMLDLENPVFSKTGKLCGPDSRGWKGMPIVIDENEIEYNENMDGEAAVNARKAIPLDEYGEGISISKKSWEKIVSNGGEEQTPYVRNKSSKTIYYKPEKNIRNYKNDGAYPIEAGKDLYMPVDGIAAPHLRKGEVYKITNNTRVTVTNNDVSYNVEGLKNNLAMVLKGKWKNSSWHYMIRTRKIYPVVLENQPTYHIVIQPDMSWDKLFSKSK